MARGVAVWAATRLDGRSRRKCNIKRMNAITNEVAAAIKQNNKMKEQKLDEITQIKPKQQTETSKRSSRKNRSNAAGKRIKTTAAAASLLAIAAVLGQRLARRNSSMKDSTSLLERQGERQSNCQSTCGNHLDFGCLSGPLIHVTHVLLVAPKISDNSSRSKVGLKWVSGDSFKVGQK